jgi:ubiquinone biosynthesis protein
MGPWDLLIDEAALEAVVPAEYSRFRKPIREALTVFLNALSAAHQSTVLAAQASLPPTASVAHRLAVLARSCPALHKLGQILARDPRLTPSLRQHLQELESLPASIPLETIQYILTQELGPLAQLGVTLQPPALAEASVAVVVPFQPDSASSGERARHGVFKVLKPGIKERLGEELELLERVGTHLDERCQELRIRPLGYREIFAQVREKLRHEVRLDLEQRHLAQARAFYAGEPRVQIPTLFEYCTPQVTAMERVWGGKITDPGPECRPDSHGLADRIVEALLARPIYTTDSQALFHGDPHAGNLFRTPDGRVAILDWSLVGTLSESERSALAEIGLGGLLLDGQRIVTALAALAGSQPVDQSALNVVVAAWLRPVRWGQLPGLAWLRGLLDEAVQTTGLRVSSDLVLFRKTLHTLEGVLADLGGSDSQVDGVLLGELLIHLAVEWPLRCLARPDSRAFASRIATVDLAQLVLQIPHTVVRGWLGRSRDLWGSSLESLALEGTWGC